ncbi:MAG: AMP-binding protein [Streptosporangiaceae bacterium]
MAISRRVQIKGDAARAGDRSIDEIIRPFGVADRGITFLDNDKRTRLSYGDLAEQVQLVAANIRREGVAPAERIAMTLTNDLQSVVVLLAAWAAGCTVVSLPPQSRGSRDWYAERFGSVLERMDCEAVVDASDTETSYLPRCSARVLTRENLLATRSGSPKPPGAEVPKIALVQFTSGSVAAPKGVAIAADVLARHMTSLAQTAEIDPSRDKFVSWLPLYHDMGLVAMFLNALASRSEQVLMPHRTFALQPARWLATLARERGTVTAAPNFAYRMASAVPYAAETDLSSVRVSINAGERVDWDVLMGFHEVTGPLGFDWGAVVPCYGLAEGVVGTTYTKPGRGARRHASGSVSVGRPMPGMLVEGPLGPPAGPISISGPCLFDGYNTVAGFVPQLVDSWFDTGDAGFIDEGELHVMGRRAETVSVAGHNVFAEDIEAVVHEKGRPSVRACAAFRLKESDQKFGLMIEINPRAIGSTTDIASFAADLRATVIAALGVRVTVLLIVRLGTIPRTTSGKVQRAECRELLSSAVISRRIIISLGQGDKGISVN